MNKTVLPIIVAMILSACGTTPQVTPAALPPTASFTPSPTKTPVPTATLTPTPTPTPKIGIVYLDPDYDLNDRVKIIEANQEALWKYTTESFMMLNSYGTDGKGTDSYMKKLAESVGIDFNDKAALLEYLKNNDIPTEIDGVQFMYTAKGIKGSEYKIQPRSMINNEKKIRLSVNSIDIISINEYPDWLDKNNVVAQLLVVVSYYDQDIHEIMGGLLPVDKDNHIEFVYIVANVNRGKSTGFQGFPDSNDTVTSKQTEKLNSYIGALVYAVGILTAGECSPIFEFYPDKVEFGLATFPQHVGVVWISNTSGYFKSMVQYREQLLDFPPDFIEPR